MKIAEVISTKIDKAKRFVKVLVMGRDDVQELHLIQPFGIDGNPVKKMRAVHAETLQIGANVIIGFVNENQEAKEGELKLFSTNGQGNQQTYIWLHDDGTIEIGGDLDNMVKYIPLNAGLQAFKGSVDANFTAIAAVLNAIVPGSYTPTPTVMDISLSKVTDVKTS